MSKVIFKLKFESPNLKGTKSNNMNHLIYIGTREGVALNDDMKEFKKGKTENDEYLKYIADRPRSHGLFNKDGNVKDIKEMANYMKNYDSYVYKAIISLKEDEAINKGFDDKEKWEGLIRDKMLYMSKQLNIPYSQLEWVGAFHRESGHPHVHLMMWDKKANVRNIGVIPKKNIENIRRELTKSIFETEIDKILSFKNVYRDFLVGTTKGIGIQAEYESEFVELDNKLNEINLKFNIKELENNIKKLNEEKTKELEEGNREEIEIKIEDVKLNIEEAKKKLTVYEIKDKAKVLEIQKEVINLENVLNLAKANGNIKTFESNIEHLKDKCGIYELQKEIKIADNQKEVIKLKSDLIGLNKKKRFTEIENQFEARGIKIENIVNNIEGHENLNENDISLKDEYIKLKAETNDIVTKGIDEIENEILKIESKFEQNKWKLNTLVENGIVKGEKNNPNVHGESIEEINLYLNKKIDFCELKIKTIKETPFENLNLSDEKIIEIKKEFNTYLDLEKKMNSEKHKNNIFKLEKELNMLKSNGFKYFKSEKHIEFEEKISKLTENLIGNNLTDDEKEKNKNEINSLNEEIEKEKNNIEIEIEKEIKKIEKDLEIAKKDICSIDGELNDFSLGGKILRKDIENISNMIIDLKVPKEGRLQYKLMPKEVKDEINIITDEIIKLPQYRKMMEQYLKSAEDLTRLYTDKPEDIENSRANAKDDIYKRVGNNILKSKRELLYLKNDKTVDNKAVYKADFTVQTLLNNITKLFSSKINQNENTKLISKEKNRAERKKLAQENKARGLYSEMDFE